MHDLIEYLNEQADTNRSFQWAFEWLTKNPGEHQLVHGVIIDPDTGNKLNSAWIETAVDVVMDFYTHNNPKYPYGVKTKDFYAIVTPTNMKKYTLKQAMAEVEQSKHHGPWHM
tara:strand:+ start:96 stop:434 length:339 start_codon:yes stop_codon:yes gene_type:complete